MNQHSDELHYLTKKGFNDIQALQFIAMKERHLKIIEQQSIIEDRRLTFSRWLVEYGKLTDHIKIEGESK